MSHSKNGLRGIHFIDDFLWVSSKTDELPVNGTVTVTVCNDELYCRSRLTEFDLRMFNGFP